MLFNSIFFIFFLPVIFTLYWWSNKKSLKFQNALLLTASYYFYACWDWRFLFLLIFSTGLDYYTGIKISNSKNENVKKIWFWLSVGVNLSFLGVFKYFNFFADSFADLLSLFGLKTNFRTLDIILPVGISFYTFHGLSYVIDIFKKRIDSEKNFIDYALFVSYFPLLVAGPIERATHLLPQIKIKRNFNYKQSVDGLKLMIWGFFKKIVVADNCALFVNILFGNPKEHSILELWLGVILFAFQIYGDFSGYTDIASGISKLFGIDLMKNFNFPYFSKDIADFWRRWHISLSSWFRDYVYIPLGGSKVDMKVQVRNTFIIFLISGFWHGANWTFIVWGLMHALYFIPLIFLKKNRKNLSNDKISIQNSISIFTTFILVCLAWIVFRADNLKIAGEYFYGLINFSEYGIGLFVKNRKFMMISLFCLFSIIVLLYKEFEAIQSDSVSVKLNKIGLVFLISIILFIGAFKNPMQFIYFQF